MFKKLLLGLLGILLLFIISAFAIFQYYRSPAIFEPSLAGLYQTQIPLPAPAAERTIKQGKLIGFEDSYDTFAWLGIPYAAPPIGDLRWRAPQEHKGWQGTREATVYGAPCIQFWGVLATIEGQQNEVVGQEDCLTLNVWAPKSADINNKKPTMVWIHGGGNDSGSSRMYQAHHLAGSQDVVVVTINYRLGLLGWFSHEAIRETSDNAEDASGNYGTLDIIQSLKWVNENIARFGGDPNNVTIFGESAGARNVYSMIASPLAKGLFHKAIAQSGTVDTTVRTLAENFPEEPNVSAYTGLRNSSNSLISLVLAEFHPNESKTQLRARIESMSSQDIMRKMRQTAPSKLMQLASDNSGDEGFIRVARVIRDAYVIPEASLLTLFNDPASYNAVPLITGTNRDEQKVFMAQDSEYIDLKWGVIPVPKDDLRYQTIADYVSQNWKAGVVDEPSKVISANQGAPVYAFRFDWDDMIANPIVDLPLILGAAHGMEVAFVFGDFQGGMPFQFTHTRQNAQGRKRLAEAMMSYWAEFAYTGAPGRGRQGDLVKWDPWRNTGDNLMLFDESKGGGLRMSEVRTNVTDIKQKLINDAVLSSQKERCRAYATLFLHGYQTSDFYSEDEYRALGCADFPVGTFR